MSQTRTSSSKPLTPRLVLVWLALVALSLIGPSLADLEQNTSALAVLAIAGVKFILIAFHFMELRSAHLLWRMLSVIYVVAIAFIIWLSV